MGIGTLALSFQHGHEVEGVKPFFIQASILTFGDAHHPLHISIVDRNDHDAAGLQLFHQFFRDTRRTGGNQHPIEGTIGRQSLKTISEKESQ